MLNKRRLSSLGFAWLILLYVLNVGMLIACAWVLVSGLNDTLFPKRPVGLQYMWRALADVASLLAVWANAAIVLAIMVWMESDRLLPHEDQAWQEAERRRRG